MSDDPTKHAQDRKRIDVSADYECRYWTEKFNISPERLKEVVKKVGPMLEDVKKELGFKD